MAFGQKYTRIKDPIKVQLFGDWDGVLLRLNHLPREIKEAARYGQRKSAEKIVKIVKDAIERNDHAVPMPPKNYNSKDSRPLVDSTTYVNAIKAWSKDRTYYAGVPLGTLSKNGRIELSYLAGILEHGNRNRNIQPRPHWAPAFTKFGGRRTAKRNVVMSIRRHLIKHDMPGFKLYFKDIF